MADLYVALVHWPVKNKQGEIVTTSITTIDIHDIARSCRTFGVRAFYIVTPVDALRALARKIIAHWCRGPGANYNPNRKEALDLARLQKTIEGVEIDIEEETGSTPVLVATSAQGLNGASSFAEVRAMLESSDRPHLLILGTGWGLSEQVTEHTNVNLEPIGGADAYNHLSVRAAAAILLDRLKGTR